MTELITKDSVAAVHASVKNQKDEQSESAGEVTQTQGISPHRVIFGLSAALVALILGVELLFNILFSRSLFYIVDAELMFKLGLFFLSIIAGSLIFFDRSKAFGGFLGSILPTNRSVEVSVYESVGASEVNLSKLSERLEKIAAVVEAEKNVIPVEVGSLSKKNLEIVLSAARAQVDEKLSQEFLSKTFEVYARGKLEEIARASDDRRFDMQDRALMRLGIQVEVLGSRANRTMTLGILFATVGLILLYMTLFGDVSVSEAPPQMQDLNLVHLIETYLPRFAMVLLVEVVAFFFLRLYAKSLSELRYVQNETTNVEMRFIALNAALKLAHVDTSSLAIKSLVETDRNGIIEKTQTTVDIEKERAASEAEASTLKALSELMHGNEKGWFWQKRG